MMSIERPSEAWEEVQRHGQDLADRLAQGISGLVQCHMKPSSFPWPNPPKSKLFNIEFPTHNLGKMELGIVNASSGIDGVSVILDIGGRIGQASADLGACLNAVVQQFFRGLTVPFLQEESVRVAVRGDIGISSQISDVGVGVKGSLGTLSEGVKDLGFNGDDGGLDRWVDEEVSGVNLSSVGHFGRPQGIVNVTSTYDSRTNDVKSSLAARGDLWRVEASHGKSASENNNSSLILVQLGPLLFVRDSTLLLPVHLSKQHLLWYGYDRKNGIHSLCPAVWSKHRKWLLMSMLCLNPVACSFLDLQFPNGQVTYLSGEGITASAFLPLCGGLLQAQGQYPGEMKLSFSYKNKMGAQFTPVLQWPDRSFTLGLTQAVAWHKSGLLVRPTIQLSASPTVGGSNPGLQAEVIHSVRDNLSLICGCSFTAHPSYFASVSVGRSKWNGQAGSSGIVVTVDTPLSRVARPSFSVQINSGLEF